MFSMMDDKPAPEGDAKVRNAPAADHGCGYTKSCQPKALQRCANAKMFLIVCSLFGIVQGFSVNGINNVNVSSYERRFLLTSKASGFVSSMYDISAGATVVFVGYFGATAHQPRLLSIALISQAFGNFIMSLAHFASPAYNPLGDSVLTCQPDSANISTCDTRQDDSYLKNYLYVLLLGMILNGFAGTTIYSIGVTYLDESVSTEDSPLYIGIMSGFSVLGPAIGYLLGGYFLSFYVDYPKAPPEGVVYGTPAWIGAWWIGFVISAVLSLFLALLMLCFPKQLPDTQAILAKKTSQAHNDGSEDRVNATSFGLTFRDMPMATLLLLKNPTFMCITILLAFELVYTSGFGTFLPKFISNQFNQDVGWGAMLTGILAIPGAALGEFLGGFICKRFKLKVGGMLKFCLGLSVAICVLMPVFWTRCQENTKAGVNAPYRNESRYTLEVDCNAGCGCDTNLYQPICANGVQYFNPCYAGCSQNPTVNAGGALMYDNCTCVSMISNSTVHSAILGVCENNCDVMLYGVFFPICFVIFLLTFMMGSPMTVAILRVVPHKQRPFAIAIHWVFLRFIGSIPGPLIFGALIDSSCVVWKEECDVIGSCWLYDNFQMAFRLFVLVMIIKVLSVICNVLSFVLYKPPPDDKKILSISMNALEK